MTRTEKKKREEALAKEKAAREKAERKKANQHDLENDSNVRNSGQPSEIEKVCKEYVLCRMATMLWWRAGVPCGAYDWPISGWTSRKLP